MLPDVKLIGHTLFTGYNLPLQIVGVLLLVAHRRRRRPQQTPDCN